MKRQRFAIGCALALLLAGCGCRPPARPPHAATLARAQAGDAGTLQQDLYQDALQSIAEGRRNDASRELKRLIENEPLHAGAWLDLAMTQCALGHADEAERLFATIETRFNPSPALLQLIAEAREEGCSKWRPASSWAFSAGRGIDQNVNQGATTATYIIGAPGAQAERELSPDFLPQHDQYSVLAGEATREVTPNGSVGFAQFMTRRNDHLRQYDSVSAFAGLDSPWRYRDWTARTTATVGVVSLGGQLYQRQLQLQARVAPPLPLPRDVQFNVLAGATHNEFLTLTNFNSNTLELRSQLSWRQPTLYASASVARLEDRALAQRPGGDRSGWFGNVLLRRRLGASVSGELSYTRQTWNSRLPYSPGVVELVRAQATGVVRAGLTYAINRNQSVQLEGRVVRNHENISIFQYNNRLLQLSWQWQGL